MSPTGPMLAAQWAKMLLIEGRRLQQIVKYVSYSADISARAPLLVLYGCSQNTYNNVQEAEGMWETKNKTKQKTNKQK